MDLEKKLLLSEYKNFNLLYENKKLKAAFQGNMNANIFNSCKNLVIPLRPSLNKSKFFFLFLFSIAQKLISA